MRQAEAVITRPLPSLYLRPVRSHPPVDNSPSGTPPPAPGPRPDRPPSGHTKDRDRQSTQLPAAAAPPRLATPRRKPGGLPRRTRAGENPKHRTPGNPRDPKEHETRGPADLREPTGPRKPATLRSHRPPKATAPKATAPESQRSRNSATPHSAIPAQNTGVPFRVSFHSTAANSAGSISPFSFTQVIIVLRISSELAHSCFAPATPGKFPPPLAR